MEKLTKILLGVTIFGVVLPCAIILPLTSHQVSQAQDLAGIRDYNAGHYDMAIQELNVYLNAHPLMASHSLFPGKSEYAQRYLGLALLKQNHYPEAISAFRIYAPYSGGNEGNYLLGVALFRNGSKTEARAIFQKIVSDEMSNGISTRHQSIVNLSEKMLDEIDHSH